MTLSLTAEIFLEGLKAGLLTFGGAFTVIPFLQQAAVADHHWLTDSQFVDGLAISGVLPAPLIIFSTFVGYIAGGIGGALAMTLGIFLPAFLFPIFFHRTLVAVAENPRIRPFLLGVAAGVIGLIAAVTVDIVDTSVVDVLHRRPRDRRLPRAQPLARQAHRALRGPRLRPARGRPAAHGPVVARRTVEPALAIRCRPRAPEETEKARQGAERRDRCGQDRHPGMSEPKLHHYVPQFHLRRFRDDSGRLWVWDRDRDRVFESGPAALAAESSFYFLDAFAKEGHDPLEMERQFSTLEYDVARITDQWIEWTREGELGMEIPIPEPNREIVALFIGLQFLRTADTRDILGGLASQSSGEKPSAAELRRLHTELLWDEEMVNGFKEYIRSAIWVIGRNDTERPLLTSDNPVAFRTSDNSMWLKAGVLGSDTYVVYPIAPDVIVYCYPRVEPWEKLAALDAHVSPVTFTPEMVQSENGAQVFMASRFVISPRSDFSEEREFAKTIGTDAYAEYWEQQRSEGQGEEG